MSAPTTTIRTIWALSLLASTMVCAQTPDAPSPRIILASATLPDAPSATATHGPSESAESSSLPDAPVPTSEPIFTAYSMTLPAAAPLLPPCPKQMAPDTPRCLVNPYRRFLDSTTPVPLSVGQKGYLAFHNFTDPGNIVTIMGTAAFTVGVNPHTAYGPGFHGFLSNTGYSFSQDATGEFFGTFLIPSIFHEDPHYHREPYAPVGHRILHALSRTLIARATPAASCPTTPSS